MRYRSKPYEVEAVQWKGPREGATFRSLQEWGAPVSTMPTAEGTVLLLHQQRVVNPGDWIVHNAYGAWSRVSDDQFREEFDVAEAGGTRDVPGFATIEATRTAFRRWTGSEWEWRHGGLTEAEARSAGWQALYAVELPA